MSHALRAALRWAARFAVVWAVDAVSLWLTAWLLPGMQLGAFGGYPTWAVALAVAFVLGLVNLLVRPLILLLALPLGFVVLFIAGLFVNAVTLRLAAALLGGGLIIDGWLTAIVAAVLLAVINMVVATLAGVEDSGSFYRGVVARRLAGQRAGASGQVGRGLVILQIDGLSFHHMRHAMDKGIMRHAAALIRDEGYALSATDCGLPSMTSASQAGILFGDNDDIPAFRWYDKAQGKLYVSSKDAAELNARYARGNGLLRGGVSINNLFDGDARHSLLTAADLTGGTSEAKRARAQDVYLLLLNPNFLLRVVGLVAGDAITEVWQYALDVVRGVEPRLNRLKKGYPLKRAATTVFMREVSGFLTMMQVVRGEPIIYTTWPGYDTVAHYAGPWSGHALGTLRGFDRFIDGLREIIARDAPRPYELLLLSDHGQSFGATFKMRYGYTLLDYIEQRLPSGTVTAHVRDLDDGADAVLATAAELGNVREQHIGGSLGQAAAGRLQEATESAAAQFADGGATGGPAADVTFCGSGNLAQVYFHAIPQRATLDQLNAAFPGLVEALAGHEGVGLVVAIDGDDAVVFGKTGSRNLRTGAISGGDPLLPYGDADLRARQLRRVAGFPSAGDLLIISAVYPDGTVAAFEEQIGSHGGLGGEQTDTFLLHPAGMTVPPTSNSADMYAILNARRSE